MRKLPAAVLSLIVLAACSDSALSPSGDLDVSASASASVDRKVDVVVVLNGHAKGKSLENKQHALSTARQMGLVPTFAYGAALTGFAAAVPEGRLRALEKDPRVQFVSPDEEFSIESQILPAGVDRVDADQSSTVAGDGTGSVNVGIAIIDSGIDPTHPDLNVAGGVDCLSNGTTGDPNGHGTHVAGTAAAIDNDIGVVGVAPGSPLYAVRVFNKNGVASASRVICGIDWVTANAATLGIRVANMSFGFGTKEKKDDRNCGLTVHDALHLAVCRLVDAGVTVVVSAENSSRDLSQNLPAAFPEVLTVTAMRDEDGIPGALGTSPPRCTPDPYPDDEATTFSNYSTVASEDTSHVIAAPGFCV